MHHLDRGRMSDDLLGELVTQRIERSATMVPVEVVVSLCSCALATEDPIKARRFMDTFL